MATGATVLKRMEKEGRNREMQESFHNLQLEGNLHHVKLHFQYLSIYCDSKATLVLQYTEYVPCIYILLYSCVCCMLYLVSSKETR